MRVRFKFHARASDRERREVLDTLAAGAERLFPDDADPELASIYVADFSGKDAAGAIAALRRAESVEFAEAEPPRHLP